MNPRLWPSVFSNVTSTSSVSMAMAAEATFPFSSERKTKREMCFHNLLYFSPPNVLLSLCVFTAGKMVAINPVSSICSFDALRLFLPIPLISIFSTPEKTSPNLRGAELNSGEIRSNCPSRNPVLRGDRECGELEEKSGGGPAEAEFLAHSGIDVIELVIL